MALRHTDIIFRRSDTMQLVSEMERISAAHQNIIVSAAKSWVNVRPYFGPQYDADMKWEPPLRRLFSARGPFVPHATWVPAHTRKRGVEPAAIGLSHPKGPSAIRQLAEGGVVIPSDWLVRQDHSRRGIVIEVGADSTCEQALLFLLDASEELSGVNLPGDWVADLVEV